MQLGLGLTLGTRRGGAGDNDIITSFEASDWTAGGASVITDVGTRHVRFTYVDTPTVATVSDFGEAFTDLGSLENGVTYTIGFTATLNSGSCVFRVNGTGLVDTTINSGTDDYQFEVEATAGSEYCQIRNMSTGKILDISAIYCRPQ